MKIFDTLQYLKQKINQLIQTINNQKIKSITGYQFYLNAFYIVFKVLTLLYLSGKFMDITLFLLCFSILKLEISKALIINFLELSNLSKNVYFSTMKKKKYDVFIIRNYSTIQNLTKSCAKNSIKAAITNSINFGVAKALELTYDSKPRNIATELKIKFLSKFKRSQTKDTSPVIKRQLNSLDILFYHRGSLTTI